MLGPSPRICSGIPEKIPGNDPNTSRRTNKCGNHVQREVPHPSRRFLNLGLLDDRACVRTERHRGFAALVEIHDRQRQIIRVCGDLGRKTRKMINKRCGQRHGVICPEPSVVQINGLKQINIGRGGQGGANGHPLLHVPLPSIRCRERSLPGHTPVACMGMACKQRWCVPAWHANAC